MTAARVDKAKKPDILNGNGSAGERREGTGGKGDNGTVTDRDISVTTIHYRCCQEIGHAGQDRPNKAKAKEADAGSAQPSTITTRTKEG